MKIIDRYLSMSVIKAILMTLLVLTLLIMVLAFIEEAEEVGKGDYRLWDAMLVSLSTIPRAIYEAFPVSALIGALLGLGTLAGHGELIAMRAAGVSLRHIVMAVVKSGLLLIVLVFIVGELLAPYADRFGEQLRLEKQKKQATLQTRYGFWAKDGNAFVNIKTILPGQRLENIRIYEFDDAGKLEMITRAGRAEYQQDRWMLEAVLQSKIDPDGIVSKRRRQSAWNSYLDPDLLSLIVMDPLMLPIWDIYYFANLMKENEQISKNYEVAFWTKVATPISTLAMLILAVPFVLGSLRSVSMSGRVFFGALVGSVFYFVSKGFSFVALVYDLYPVTAAIFPLLALVLTSVFFFRRMN